MYKILNILSAFIRQFCLPNPYLNYFESSLYADIFNIFIGGTILHLYSFFLTSSIYEKGIDSSWLGCIGYCTSYIFNTFLVQYLCYYFAMLEIQYILMIGFVLNVIIYILIKVIKEKILNCVFCGP